MSEKQYNQEGRALPADAGPGHSSEMEPASGLHPDGRVSASAEDRVRFGRKSVLRFHPLGRAVRDGTLRCAYCGQLDDGGFHDAAFCPALGGALPFPTSSLTLKLKADSGYRSTETWRITHLQWVAICRILSPGAIVAREIVDQDGNEIGTANTPVADLLKVEAFVDERGTVWTPPTAWAYFAACRARDVQVDTGPKGGDSSEAPAPPGSAVGVADAPEIVCPCSECHPDAPTLSNSMTDTPNDHR